MQIAIDCAGFSPAEADKLRRAMATFRRAGTIHKLKEDFINGMVDNEYEQEFAERCFKQIEGFGEYGFPESHAASFAILVYVSSWVKWHYPEVFCAALLNSQPMGFYAPAQLVRDAREHGVEVRPPDINASDWDCTLEKTSGDRCALRLGFRQVSGLTKDDMKRLVERRHDALSRSGRSVAARRPHQAADPGARPRRRLRLDGPVAPRRAVGGARLLRSRRCRCSTRAPRCAISSRRSPCPASRSASRSSTITRLISMSLRAHPLELLRPMLSERRMAHSQQAARSRATTTSCSWPAWCWCASGRARPRAWCSSPSRTNSASPISWSGPRSSRPTAASSWARACWASRARCSARGQCVIHLVAERLWDWSAELDRIADLDGHLELRRAAATRSATPIRRRACRSASARQAAAGTSSTGRIDPRPAANRARQAASSTDAAAHDRTSRYSSTCRPSRSSCVGLVRESPSGGSSLRRSAADQLRRPARRHRGRPD